MAKFTYSAENTAKETDPLYRVARIGLYMDLLQDPDKILKARLAPEKYLQLATMYYNELINQTAQRIGVAPEILADEDKRTEEQAREISITALEQRIVRLEQYLNSRYITAIKHINTYCAKRAEEQGIENIYAPLEEETPSEAILSGELVNVPIAAVLFFFASNPTLDPGEPGELTDKNKAELNQLFESLDAIYLKNRDSLKSEYALLSTYLDSLNPKDPAAKTEQLEQITALRARVIDYPVDKVNSKIWKLLEESTKGQLCYNIPVAKKGSKQEIDIMYAVDFDQLEDVKITKRLTVYDKRVYVAASALFNAGNDIITLTQIYYAMGYTGRPGSKDLERINAAITKMGSTKIYISNAREAEIYHYDKFIYDGALLPMERTTAISNGRATDAAIHLFREPPVITFAKGRKQFTTFDLKLLQSRVNKTDKNLLIDDYLLEQISKAKREKKSSQRLLYKTIFERTQIQGGKNQTRALDAIRRYLEHYQECDFINHFTEEPNGVTVYFFKQKTTTRRAKIR